MTDDELEERQRLSNTHTIKQLSVGKVVEWHRPSYLNHILYVHVVRFVRQNGWSLETGIVVNCYGREVSIPLEEIRL
jgi:hypothetical protein